MATHADFASEEWQALELAVFWACDALGKASTGQWAGPPSGSLPDDALAAMAAALGPTGRAGRPRGPLTTEVFGSLGVDLGAANARYAADGRRIDLGLTAAADALDARATPEEAGDFKLAVLEAATDVAGRGGREVTPADRLFSHLLQVNLRQTPHGVPEPSHTARFRPSEWLALEWAPFWTASVIGGADGAVVEAERLPISAMLAKGPEQPDPLLREVLAWVDRDFRSIQGLATNLTGDLAAAEQALTDIPKVLSTRVTPEEAKSFRDALVNLAFETMVADGEVKMETEAAATARVRQALQA